MDGTNEGAEIDIQQSRTHIAAHWKAFEDLESEIIRVTWCAGLSPAIWSMKLNLPHPVRP